MKKIIDTGLEQLQKNIPAYLTDKKLGLLCNPASVDKNFNHAVSIVNDLFPGQLKALFSPQHGFHAEKQDNMIESAHSMEPELHIPIHSLYSETRIPTKEMFDSIDVLLVDLQDVGTRVYTFMYTVSHCMEACAAFGKKMVILDRPNPVDGIHVEGNILEPEWASFVGRFPIPMRHGLTMGELCLLFQKEFDIDCDLDVIPMQGWKRSMLWEDTGLVWIAPSPNLPRTQSCQVYPGQVILEGTNLSEGRGTTLPFEQFGAPFLDTKPIKQQADQCLEGIFLREISFEPTSGKWQRQVCKGFHIHVTDKNLYQPYLTSLWLVSRIMEQCPDEFSFITTPYEYEYERLPMDLILGSQRLRKKLQENWHPQDMKTEWNQDTATFVETCKLIYLYDS